MNLGAYNFIGILNSEIRSWMNLPPQQSRLGRGRGAGSHLHCHFNFPANASNGPTLPPPTTVWSIGFTIHYPLTSLGAVFLKETTNSNRFEFQNNSLKSWFLFSWGSNCFLSSVGKNLCKGRDVELNRRAPRLKRASFSTLTTVSPCSHCTMLVVVNKVRLNHQDPRASVVNIDEYSIAPSCLIPGLGLRRIYLRKVQNQ